jgi:curved DNA-binding protein CbpA
MQNLYDLHLYDLLGVDPNDDAENLRKAYRKAAKESHPDHHGGDPEAALRFRQITEAYDLLRDAEQRAAYDQWLESERRPLRWKLKRAFRDMKRHIVSDVAAGAVLAVVLAGGYELYAGLSPMPAGEGVGIAAVRLAVQSGTATPQMPMPILIPVAIPVAPIPVAPGALAAAVVKQQQAASHSPIEQASLENRNIPACADSQSCSADTQTLSGGGN